MRRFILATALAIAAIEQPLLFGRESNITDPAEMLTTPEIAEVKNAEFYYKQGGIILLAIRFFPQFLVFGYSYWGWQLKNQLKSFPLAWNLKNK